AEEIAHSVHHVRPVFDAHSAQPVGLGQLGEVRGKIQVNIAVALFEKDFLPLADHSQRVVVDDGDLDRHVILGHGGEIVQRHLELAVADDGEYFEIREGELLRYLRRYTEAVRGPVVGV